MDRVLHERLERRESGRRRVSWVSKLSAIAAAAVAVAFGVGFAHQPNGTSIRSGTSDSQSVTPRTTSDSSGDESGDESDDTGQSDSRSNSGTLQTPDQPPAYTQNDGQSGHSSSGGS